eukprot:3407295-Amphidinium_carterae.5
MPILPHLSNFETILRQKLLSAITKSFEQHCLKYGFLLASDILFYILRKLVPSEPHARVSMTVSLMTPTTLTALAEFMESWLTKLHVGLQLGVHLEPMKCLALAVLKHATNEGSTLQCFNTMSYVVSQPHMVTLRSVSLKHECASESFVLTRL